jgi:capsular polysaccharide biosynthesis protein
MKNKIALFFAIDKISLERVVFILTVAVMLAAIILGLLMLWTHPPYTASTASFELKSRSQQG